MLEYTMGINDKAKYELNDINIQLKEEFIRQKEEEGLTMDWFVRRTKINDSYLYQWLKGNVQLKEFHTLWKVAKILQVKITFS